MSELTKKPVDVSRQKYLGRYVSATVCCIHALTRDWTYSSFIFFKAWLFLMMIWLFHAPHQKRSKERNNRLVVVHTISSSFICLPLLLHTNKSIVTLNWSTKNTIDTTKQLQLIVDNERFTTTTTTTNTRPGRRPCRFWESYS